MFVFKFRADLVLAIWALTLGSLTTTFAQTMAPSFSDSITTDLKTNILADLKMVQELQGAGATPIYRQMFGDNLNGQNLTQFFAKRIQNFDMSDCGGMTGILACANSSHTMWITPTYATYDVPQVYRIGVLFHESRHTEKENQEWWHVNCPTPFLDDKGNDIKALFSGTSLAGFPACDETAFGAYGLQVELLKNIELNCTNCTAKMKMDGKIFGDNIIQRIVDQKAHEQLKTDVQRKK